MATVEEIIVRFTGDASSLVNASEKAKVKTFGLGEQLLKLDKQMQKVFASANPDIAKAEELFRKMENTAKRLAMRLEEIKKQENKQENQNIGGAQSFLNRGIDNIKSQIVTTAINAVSAVARRAAEDIGGYTAAMREMNKVEYESGQIQMKRVRAIGDKDAMFQQKLGLMVDPETGRQNIEGQKKTLQDEILAGAKRLDEAKANVARAEKELETYEDSRAELINGVPSALTKGQAAKIPGLGMGEAENIKLLEKGRDEARQLAQTLEADQHAKVEQQKKLNNGKSNYDLTKDQIAAMNYQIKLQQESAGMTDLEVNALKQEAQIRKDLEELGKSEAEITKAIHKDMRETNELIKKQVDIKEEVRKKTEKEANIESVKRRLEDIEYKKASRGFKGAEAFVLEQKAKGIDLGNAEILQDADIQEADALKEHLETPYEKAQKQIDRVNRMRQDDLISAETYARAMAEIDKSMKGPGPAASRAATGYGSAEHAARMYAYNQVMTQPATQQANIDRLSRETPKTTTDLQKEANGYLRDLRNKEMQKRIVEVRAANFGGG